MVVDEKKENNHKIVKNILKREKLVNVINVLQLNVQSKSTVVILRNSLADLLVPGVSTFKGDELRGFLDSLFNWKVTGGDLTWSPTSALLVRKSSSFLPGRCLAPELIEFEMSIMTRDRRYLHGVVGVPRVSSESWQLMFSEPEIISLEFIEWFELISRVVTLPWDFGRLGVIEINCGLDIFLLKTLGSGELTSDSLLFSTTSKATLLLDPFWHPAGLRSSSVDSFPFICFGIVSPACSTTNTSDFLSRNVEHMMSSDNRLFTGLWGLAEDGVL